MRAMMLIGCMALSAAAAQGPVVMTDEPRHPSEFEQKLTLACGSNRLRIVGYGPALPARAGPAILIDGRPLEGASALLADLSKQSGVYRLTGQCPQESPAIELNIYHGESSRDGIRYRSGRATIVAGRVESYTGLEEASEETFW